MVKSLKPLWEENLQLDDHMTHRSVHSESGAVQDNKAGTIPGSARSQKSTSVNFKTPGGKSEQKIVKQTMKKPERKLKKMKK
jgi:hypothetical protein